MIHGNRGCLERGWVNINDISHCGNDKCESCNMLSEAFKKVAEDIFSKYTAGTDPYKEDAPVNIFLQDEVGQWQSLPDRMKDTQEEYNKLLDKLNKESLPD